MKSREDILFDNLLEVHRKKKGKKSQAQIGIVK